MRDVEPNKVPLGIVQSEIDSKLCAFVDRFDTFIHNFQSGDMYDNGRMYVSAYGGNLRASYMNHLLLEANELKKLGNEYYKELERSRITLPPHEKKKLIRKLREFENKILPLDEIVCKLERTVVVSIETNSTSTDLEQIIGGQEDAIRPCLYDRGFEVREPTVDGPQEPKPGKSFNESSAVHDTASSKEKFPLDKHSRRTNSILSRFRDELIYFSVILLISLAIYVVFPGPLSSVAWIGSSYRKTFWFYFGLVYLLRLFIALK